MRFFRSYRKYSSRTKKKDKGSRELLGVSSGFQLRVLVHVENHLLPNGIDNFYSRVLHGKKCTRCRNQEMKIFFNDITIWNFEKENARQKSKKVTIIGRFFYTRFIKCRTGCY